MGYMNAMEQVHRSHLKSKARKAKDRGMRDHNGRQSFEQLNQTTSEQNYHTSRLMTSWVVLFFTGNNF